MSKSRNGDSPVAAVDLGSNSFHLLIARVRGEELKVLDRLREPVRMAAGLDAAGTLDERALERLLGSLERFRERLVNLPAKRVRAVGTDTFRRVKRPGNLLAQASAALGVPIEILPGGEEARLIFLGVAHGEPAIEGRRLVIDVGGGSTECILGEQFVPHLKHSLSMGCVHFTKRFFGDGRLTRRAFRKAEVAASLELEPVAQRYKDLGWEECIGASGTINAVHELVRSSGWTEGALEHGHVKRLQSVLIEAEEVSRLEMPGLSVDRAQVLAGGLAILAATFEALELEQLRTSKAALREGVLFDLLGRIRHEDVRDRTIRALSKRYHLDTHQSERVEQTALSCLQQVADAWGLQSESHAQLLSWSAKMHEIGLALSYSGHHKHGAYILQHSDMPGFSQEDQLRLSTLVRGHRRRLTRAAFSDLGSGSEALLRLCVLLRISARLHRSRSSQPLPSFHLRTSAEGLDLHFPSKWLGEHPLSHADLEEEERLLGESGIRLRIVADEGGASVPA